MNDFDLDDKKGGSDAVVTEKPVDLECLSPHAKAGDVDAAADLVAGFEGEVDPAEALRVRRKIDRWLLPPMMILYFVQFADKTTLGAAANLGIMADTHMTKTEYNALGTVFYASYLFFCFPQSWALQRFHIGKWMAANVLVWGVALFAHAACKNFAGLLVCRLILGACEGSITAGFLAVTSAFYRQDEAARRVVNWFLMNGTAQIISGLAAYGVLHTTGTIEPWRIFFLIWASVTMLTGLYYLFLFPTAPATAWFLTERERIIAVERMIQDTESYSSQGSKVWKMEQFVECLTDWKTWAFFLFAALDNVPNSLTNQNSIIIKSLGFTRLQTTLLGCVSGVVEILTIYAGSLCIRRWPNSRAVISAVFFVPNVIGSALILALPFSNKVGQLVSLYITGVGTTGFVLGLAWCSSVTSGTTKSRATNAILLVGYCGGNLAAPQMWLEKYAPRNTIPWTIILVCYAACLVIMPVMAYFLRKENRRRDALPNRGHGDDFGSIDEVQPDGTVISKRVPIEFCDLTDRDPRNMRFRYVL